MRRGLGPTLERWRLCVSIHLFFLGSAMDDAQVLGEHGSQFKMRRMQYDDLATAPPAQGCCACCGSHVCGVPRAAFVSVLVFLLLLYGGHASVTWMNLHNWQVSLCSKGLKEYVFSSSILLVASLLGGCFVGAHVGDRNRFVTALAVLVDVIILGMIGWGVSFFATGSSRCDTSPDEEQPSLLLFWRITFFFWVFHFFFVFIMINCWGRLKRDMIVGL